MKIPKASKKPGLFFAELWLIPVSSESSIF